jgi:uncharacterized protein YjbI with pentapeptide repeats
LILKTTRHRDYYSQIADSSNSFCQIINDTLNLHLSTGRFEGAYFLNIKIAKDTSVIDFHLFDNYSKYTYTTKKLTITLDKKTLKTGDYVIAKVAYNSIGNLNDGRRLQYDTVDFAGIIRLKIRDTAFTTGDLMEEDFKSRFYSETKQRPDTMKRLVLYTSKWLTDIPKEILLYTNLEELYLDGTDLSKANLHLLCNLTHLKHLTLSDCKLSEIPICFSSLKQLEELALSSNHFKSIPESIYEMANLKDLDFEGNSLSVISPNIKKLKNLESIGLGRTSIVRLPEEMVSLPKLKEIYTNDTMKYIPKPLLKYLQNDYFIEK